MSENPKLSGFKIDVRPQKEKVYRSWKGGG
jgi:hypothetical protein